MKWMVKKGEKKALKYKWGDNLPTTEYTVYKVIKKITRSPNVRFMVLNYLRQIGENESRVYVYVSNLFLERLHCNLWRFDQF